MWQTATPWGRFGGPFLCYMLGMDTPTPSQLDKFKEAARQLDTDDDPERFKERVGKLVRHKPLEKPE